ncbi:DUF3868 domain-containing protein [Bacteroides sp.]|uniref:DUF3868 domain-containing protein n=1 Tax=Bacteroides sp. TaxID=29523 RepID=UPI00259010EA|nr:DUF3868 domain-containing protein [Bacteroides sp.]
MKKTIILLTCLLAASPAVWAQNAYLEQLKVENRSVEKVNRSVRVTADFNLDDMKLNTQHSLRLVPVIVSADGTHELPLEPIVVNGKVRSKVIERQLALGEAQADNITFVRRDNGKPQTLHYTDEVPFKVWMLNGRLDLRAYVTGCAACDEGDELLATGVILPYQAPVLVVSPFVQPEEEEVKRRAEVKMARLEYPVNGYNVLPDFRKNRAELDSVQHSLETVKRNLNLTVTGIYVTGYASPEGTIDYNLRLSQRRAETFATYVQKQNPELKKDLWHVAWKGEDWDGFVAQVAQAEGWSARAKVQEAIGQCGDNRDACEWKIRQQLSKDDYRYLIDELYAPLRRNEYRIEYNVRNFTLDEAKEVLKTRPDLLSVAEIQRVADSYGRNSDGYRKALDVAVRTYPDNIAARHNAALAALETEHYAEAIALLKDATDGSLLNLLGVAYQKNGQTSEADAAFAKASQAGNDEAARNLQMLRRSLEMLAE